MHGEGWRRLWELVKWLTSIAAGLYTAFTLFEAAPQVEADKATNLFVGVLLVSGVIGGATGLFLHAIEWVYRGFRPLPTAPTEADQPPPPGEPEASPEPRLALGHQETQQSPSASPASLREPVQRE